MFSAATVGASTDGELIGELVAPLGCTEATGADFLMSLCGLRIGAGSFEVERVFVPVVGSDTWAFPCPSATNCSPDAAGDSDISTVITVTGASETIFPAGHGRDSKCCMNPPHGTSVRNLVAEVSKSSAVWGVSLAGEWKLRILKEDF